MDHFNQDIYEQLLADERFILWALGKNEDDHVYWAQWQKDRAHSSDAFSEACRTVQLFRFKSPEISAKEVNDRWLLSGKRMKRRVVPFFNPDTINWYRRLAGILIFPLLLLSAWFFHNQQQLKSEFSQLSGYNLKKSIRVVAPMGGQIQVDLPDGSEAWLNSGSEINYPPFFSDEKREVEITGEVYFRVFKGNEIFIVKNPGPTIKVYGTEFNVHAYSDEKEVTVALAKGKVTLEQNGKEIAMSPGEVAVFDRSKGRLIKHQSDIYLYTSWREGKYIFRDAPLETVLKTLERNYNVTIHLEDASMRQFKYDATINGEPLEQILELLTFSAPLKYECKRQQLKADGSYSKAEVKLWKDTTKIPNPK